MAVVNPPYALQASTAHTAKLFRRALGGLIGAEGIAAFNTPSPFGLSGDLAVSQRGAGANMSVDVARGGAYIQGDDATDQGYYFMYNDATLNVAISAADPTNPRIDNIIARIKDTSEGGAAGDTSVIEVTTGTPAGSPSAPAVPASAIKLAQVAVAAAASSITNANITNFRSMAQTSMFERANPSVKATRNSSNQVISNSTLTAVAFNDEVWDTDAFHSTSTNNSRLTIPTGFDGKYRVVGQFSWLTAPTGPIILIYKNGGAVQSNYIVDTVNFTMTILGDFALNAGDYIEIFAFHSSGGNRSIVTGEFYTFASMSRIS